ncbi:CMRF35-like molecule 2 [Scleropages formosus]|uniref:CMRF35-like molecule 2 n=1 Tax=Scleropages formosus TaxID=113540 RepID=UPI0010FA7A00|nr:CMRF35-like molecule 2 [Scleropages formosus]
MEVTGHVGQDVTVQCSHILARGNGKYFCKGHCSRDADVLIKTEEGQRNKKIGRLSLYDNGTGTFWVTITGLKKTDTGTYWCAVKRSIIADTFTEVSLTVLDAPPPGTSVPIQVGGQTTAPHPGTPSAVPSTVSNSTTPLSTNTKPSQSTG